MDSNQAARWAAFSLGREDYDAIHDAVEASKDESRSAEERAYWRAKARDLLTFVFAWDHVEGVLVND